MFRSIYILLLWKYKACSTCLYLLWTEASLWTPSEYWARGLKQILRRIKWFWHMLKKVKTFITSCTNFLGSVEMIHWQKLKYGEKPNCIKSHWPFPWILFQWQRLLRGRDEELKQWPLKFENLKLIAYWGRRHFLFDSLEEKTSCINILNSKFF